jgi:hypothetical protein
MGSMLFGIALLACLIGWVAKVAEARGRIALGWAAASLVIGVTAFLVGAGIFALALDSETSDSLTMVAVLVPPVLGYGSMIGLGLALQRLPIKTSSRLSWPISDLTAGAESVAGRLAIEKAMLRFDLPSPRLVPLTDLRTAKVDGECVRLSWQAGGETREALLMPRGKPDTPEGRRQQSRVIEQRLRERITPRA